jgi:hypothetical protein
MVSHTIATGDLPKTWIVTLQLLRAARAVN